MYLRQPEERQCGAGQRPKPERVLTGEPTPNRLRLALSQLIAQFKMPTAEGEKRPFPRLRNFILDALAEGRRKKIAHVLFEADIGGVKNRLAEHRLRTGESVTLTSYIAKGFACAIADDKRMQSYRLGRSHLIVFDDVDLMFLVEREWEGETLPVLCIVRAADRKTAHEINQELQAARQTPLGTHGPMSALEMLFFLLPSVLRKPLWFIVRRNPYWFKDLAGTAAVTSMGMYTSGAAVGVPITPMTLTLTIGSIEKKLILQDGQVVERDVIHLNLSVDHDIIDGAPLMRFVDRFKKILLKGTSLGPSAEERQD
jgi:pyruvate/2-oxoglutarate dehydrogenase complex dihydrolipoamide acyltransferase (E2) component